MPKNKKKKSNKSTKQTRQLPLADVGQLYGISSAPLGDKRFNIQCQDGKTRICRVRGSMGKRKSNRVTAGSHVIIALREYQDDKGDIIFKLSDEEVRRLKHMGEIIDMVKKSGENEEGIEESIEWDHDDEKIELKVDEDGNIDVDDI